MITDIREETPDVKTFRVNAPEAENYLNICRDNVQWCARLASVKECFYYFFTNEQRISEFSIKKCGTLTDYLHSLEVGDEITVRGPYGNYFPVETELKGKNLLFIAGESDLRHFVPLSIM